MLDTIRTAETAADFDEVARLVSNYVSWCRERFQAHPCFVDLVFGHQALASELENLVASYSPPKGRALVAIRDGRIGGTVAYRRLADGVCEMKRLFVSRRLEGHGTGRRLCETLIALARDDGYRLMRLDTTPLMTEATRLYESLGFESCDPYLDYPVELRPFIVFMELPLRASGPGGTSPV